MARELPCPVWARIDGEWQKATLDRWHREWLGVGYRWRGLVWVLDGGTSWIWVEAVDLRPREPDEIV